MAPGAAVGSTPHAHAGIRHLAWGGAIDHALSLIGFAIATSATPGPNVLMVAAAAAQSGLRPDLPRILGITIGFPAMVFAVALGLGAPFTQMPGLHRVMQWAGGAWLPRLAWKIATSPPPSAGDTDGAGKPMTFIQAALFQWVNPKAWTMALTAIAVYARSRSLPAVLLVAAVFGVINLPSVGVWAAMGQYLRRWMTDDRRRRAFNWGMAALLVGSLGLAL